MSREHPRRPPPFNPLDKEKLGESVAHALLETKISNLPPEKAFVGAGIYAIYYTGDFKLYAKITARNTDHKYAWPIYVGKAVPAGARKGGYGLGADPKQALFKRLREHADSIGQTENLKLADFKCRFLVVEDIWIPLAESLLIETYSPLWNRQIDGFGNHDPGKGRRNQQRSQWDTIHPGRPWAKYLREPSVGADEIRENVAKYVTDTLQIIRFPQDT